MTCSKELLAELHGVVGEQLLKRIKTGQATASEFAQAIKFLQANGIDASPAQNASLLGLSNALLSKLPSFSEDDYTIN